MISLIKFVIAVLALGYLGWANQELQQYPFLSHLITFLVNIIVLTFILYVAGLVVVGGERARIGRALAIAFLGAFVSFVLEAFFMLLQSSLNVPWEYSFVLRILLSFGVWLSLIKNFYRTGWLGAFAVAILSLIIMIALEFLLKPFL